MQTYFVPYTGESPAALQINGHRVVLLARDRAQLENELTIVGADRVCPIDDEDFSSEEHLLSYMAETTHAHIVVTPSEIPLSDIIENLERELPWIQ